jgi:hypothetical protein
MQGDFQGADEMITQLQGGAAVALAEDALVGVDAVKARLGEGADDARVIACINSASAWIQRITGRTFKAQGYAEFVPVAPGQREVSLKHFPVIGHIECHVGPGRGIHVRRTRRALEATACVKEDALVLRWVDGLGGEFERRVELTEGMSLARLAAEVSGLPGWSARAGADCAAGMLIPGEVIDAQVVGLTAYLQACVRRVDCAAPGEAGVVVLPRGVSGVLRVAYRAGYERVPAEVEDLCLRMAVRGYCGVPQ